MLSWCNRKNIERVQPLKDTSKRNWFLCTVLTHHRVDEFYKLEADRLGRSWGCFKSHSTTVDGQLPATVDKYFTCSFPDSNVLHVPAVWGQFFQPSILSCTQNQSRSNQIWGASHISIAFSLKVWSIQCILHTILAGRLFMVLQMLHKTQNKKSTSSIEAINLHKRFNVDFISNFNDY